MPNAVTEAGIAVLPGRVNVASVTLLPTGVKILTGLKKSKVVP